MTFYLPFSNLPFSCETFHESAFFANGLSHKLAITYTGQFTNYYFNFFYHLPPSSTSFNLYTLTKSRHFCTTYPPCHVNVVCERPIMLLFCMIQLANLVRFLLNVIQNLISERIGNLIVIKINIVRNIPIYKV